MNEELPRRHAGIPHQGDTRPDREGAQMSNCHEPCEDCGFGHEHARLVRCAGSAETPCPSCLWAYDPPEPPAQEQTGEVR